MECSIANFLQNCLATASKAQEDEFATLLELAKEDKTVHNLQWTPSPRVVFYHEDQIDDILRDCCSPESKSILSIDTTFNVGNFYLTSTTYQSKKVLNKKTGEPANLPGPAMFHTIFHSHRARMRRIRWWRQG